ncbi:hypothetical protein D3C81_1506260 [compost metagenome]
MVIFSLGLIRATWFIDLRPSPAGSPLMLRITSPSCNPAFAAGPSRKIPATTMPGRSFMPYDSASSWLSGCTSIPSQPRITWPCSMIDFITSSASFTGMAKPMPCEPPDLEKIAVLMPIRLPLASTSAPPELPGLIAASVWMKSS